ncbi:MAG: nuclear transport factor 2 family protein [Dehalococcoidia bacterium]
MTSFDLACAQLDRLVAAIAAGDTEAIRAIYHPAARIWHNFDNLEQTPDENFRILRWMHRQVSGIRYEDIRRLPAGDSAVVQEHILRGRAKDGTEIAVPACIVFHFDGDGRIVRLAEYLDTAQTAAMSR